MMSPDRCCAWGKATGRCSCPAGVEGFFGPSHALSSKAKTAIFVLVGIVVLILILLLVKHTLVH
jgi:hypothetical protein